MRATPIITGLAAYGMSGEVFHGPLLDAHPGFVVKSVVERHAEKSMQRFPHAQILRSVEELVKDPEIELVIVNTPHSLHFSHAKVALEAGKHVVVEKPFTVTVDEGAELIKLANEKRLVLTVFHNRRWDSDMLTVRHVLDSKRLGYVVEAEFHYDRFRNYIQQNTWKEEAGPGSGILYNLGSHMLDQALVLFGMPQWVNAITGIQRKGGSVDDFYDIRLEYPELLVIIKSSYLVCSPGPRDILHGSQGSFVKYDLDPQEEALKKGGIPGSKGWGEEAEEMWGTLTTAAGKEVKSEKVPTVPGNYLEFYNNLHGAIRNGDALAVEPEEALNVIRLIECAIQSSNEHRAIQPSKE